MPTPDNPNRPLPPPSLPPEPTLLDSVADAPPALSATTGRPPVFPPKTGFWRSLKANTAFKLLFVAVLALLLFIPLGQINALRAERHGRQQEAVADITRAWGGSQTLVGPLLAVPYTVKSPDLKKPASVEYAYFLPDQLEVEGALNPELRYRGIYQAILYQAELSVSGRFGVPDLAAAGVEPDKVKWNDIEVTFAVTDLRGVKEDLNLVWGGHKLRLVPGSRVPTQPTGLSARLGPFFKAAVFPDAATAGDAANPANPPDFSKGPVSFSFKLPLNGSQSLRLAPVGKQTAVRLASAWKDPSFQGNILPETRDINDQGFTASWRTTWYGNDLPPQWSDSQRGRFGRDTLEATFFGVDLAFPVDQYRLVERALKYGFLFITLAFTAFFLFEILGRRRIHPFQYALIGGALCLFYLALLALSEVTRFDLAYLAGAAAAVFLVTFYCSGVLGGRRNGLRAGGALALVYAYLFVVLKLQDWSLVAGTVGVFVALFVLMAATRRIDWYASDRAEATDKSKP